MRKNTFIILVVAFLFLPFSARAQEEMKSGMSAKTGAPADMGAKLKRGGVDLVTGWMEFPMQAAKGYTNGYRGDEQNKLGGIGLGLVRGFFHAIGRTLSGASDILTFWAAQPKGNDAIGLPLDAPYAWETGTPHEAFEPNFADATIAPMVNKLFRGGGNALFGFMEMPKQVGQGVSDGSFGWGIGKGLYYWLSREAAGICDFISAPFPAAKAPAGLYLDDEFGWDSPW